MKLLKRIVYSWQITMESRCQVFDYVILLVRGGVDTVINTVTQNNIFYYRILLFLRVFSNILAWGSFPIAKLSSVPVPLMSNLN